MPARRIDALSWDEVAEALTPERLVILPIGAFAKEHGLHLPMNTDALTAEAVAMAAAERLDALVAPVIGFGFYPAFTRYAGSQSLSRETFRALLAELTLGLIAHGARRLLLFNTGVSIEKSVEDVAALAGDKAQIVVAHLRLLGKNPGIEWQQKSGGHADERETSLMLAIAPQLVRMERAVNAQTLPNEQRKPILSPWPDAQAEHSPSGATGDPTKASAEKGRRLFAALVDDIVDLVGRA
jgi:creatinine amidohydrolase